MKRHALFLISSLFFLSIISVHAKETLPPRGDGEGAAVVVGTFGDKAVKAYRKKIPAQAEGYYLKVTPTEVVVAGRDESGTF